MYRVPVSVLYLSNLYEEFRGLAWPLRSYSGIELQLCQRILAPDT
jgi:hypothetical protein